jgi:hypothetical protein
MQRCSARIPAKVPKLSMDEDCSSEVKEPIHGLFQCIDGYLGSKRPARHGTNAILILDENESISCLDGSSLLGLQAGVGRMDASGRDDGNANAFGCPRNASPAS